MRDRRTGEAGHRQAHHIRWWQIALALTFVALLDGYELIVTLPELSRLGDAPIFDLRVGGYTHAETISLLDALGAQGRWYYFTHHIPADTALALVEAVAIVLIVLRATRPGACFGVAIPPYWRMALLAAPMLMLMFDLGENALVTHMLLAPPPAPLTAAVASTLTQAKCVMASLSIALAIVLPLTAWTRGRKRLQPQQSSSS